MTFIETCIIVLIIGFVAMLLAYVTIEKFFNEKKKESDRALQTIGAVTDNISKSMAKLFENNKEE